MGNAEPRVSVSFGLLTRIEAIGEDKWIQLEKAFGRALSTEERGVIFDLTENYLNFRKQEGRNVPTVRDVSTRVKRIRDKSNDLSADLAIDWNDISTHNTPEAQAVIAISCSKDGDGMLVEQLQAALNVIIESCDQALERHSTTRSSGYQKGFAWEHAVKMMHIKLFPNHPPRKGVGKSDSAAGPFVRFVDAWQKLLPKDARRASLDQKGGALQSAINKALRGK